jgi:hypothetical protein
MDDSALLLALVFAAIVLLLLVAAVVVRATSTDRGAERGERPEGEGEGGHDPRAPGQTRGADGSRAGNGHVHRDRDPDRLAGGRASTHSH